MNYITNSTDSQEMLLTVDYEFTNDETVNVDLTLSKDGNNESSQSYSATLVNNGYYSTLTMSGIDVDLETNYKIEIKKDSNTIYKGKAFVTNQTIGEYEINNDNYIKQTTHTSNDFIIRSLLDWIISMFGFVNGSITSNI